MEVCTVTIGGSNYRDWTHVAVTREFGAPVSLAKLQIVERSAGDLRNWSSMKISIGTLASVALGGRPVINGVVQTRQGSLQAERKGVQIDVVSKTIAAVEGSAPVKPGEYRKYNFQQMASSMLGEVGVGLKTVGAVGELSKPFELFRVIPGERIIDAIDRLAMFRNVFFTDDENGDLVVGRGTPGSAPALIEGVNIRSMNLVMSNPWLALKVELDNSRPGNDQQFGDLARTVSAFSPLAGSAIAGTYRIQGELTGDADDMKLRADHEVAGAEATSIECVITVPGWFTQSGDLWISHVGKDVSITSPSLIPTGTFSPPLKIKSVTHTQSPDQSGTETQIVCCHPGGLGAGPDTKGAGAGAGVMSAQPARPNGEEQ